MRPAKDKRLLLHDCVDSRHVLTVTVYDLKIRRKMVDRGVRKIQAFSCAAAVALE